MKLISVPNVDSEISATGTFNSNKGFNDRNQFYKFQTEI